MFVGWSEYGFEYVLVGTAGVCSACICMMRLGVEKREWSVVRFGQQHNVHIFRGCGGGVGIEDDGCVGHIVVCEYLMFGSGIESEFPLKHTHTHSYIKQIHISWPNQEYAASASDGVHQW